MLETNYEVPFFSFQSAPKGLKQEWATSINRVIEKGQFILGDEVREFEKSWAKANDSKYAVGVSNGQDGLILALRALGVRRDDVVVVPAHSFIATHNAILNVGAIPYSIDVDEYGLISAELLSNLSFTPAAVIAVHMHGQMCEMDEIMKWATKNDVPVIEDCSQAHLANHRGKKAGTFGNLGVFSLYPTKNLGAIGDSGIVVTDSKELFQIVSRQSNYGSSLGNKYEHKEFGLNNRLDEIQAAVLNVNLPKLDFWNARRREIANLYFEGLRNSPLKILQKPLAGNVWHHFCIMHKQRDELRNKLAEKGIQTEIHYPNLAGNECERMMKIEEKTYKNAIKISTEILSLPISPWHTDDQIHYVIKCLIDHQ
jgi:dTDP-4-amino-4,6-dideoxygalactose transaminase